MSSSEQSGNTVHRARFMKWLRYGIGALLLGIAVALVYDRRDDLLTVARLSWAYLALSLVISLCSIASVAWAQNCVLRLIGIRVPALESTGLTVLSMMLNKFLPLQGGTVSRYGYLRHRYGLDFKRFIAGTLFWLAVSIFFAGLIGLVALLYVWITQDRLPSIFGMIFLAQTLAAIVTVKSQRLLGKAVGKWFGFHNWRQVWERFDTRRDGLGLSVPAILICILYIAQIFVAFQALSFEIRIADAMLAGVLLYTLSRWVITPGNMGVREMLFAATFGAMGYPVEQVITASLVGRGVHFVAIMTLGLVFQSLLSRKLIEEPAPPRSGKE